MGAERPLVIEQRERLGVSALWLTGVFEIAGGMGFAIYRKKGHRYAYPYIHITDSDQELVDFFLDNFGGRTIDKYSSTEWKIEGHTAIPVAERLERHSLTRKDIIDSFKEWQTASRDERVEIAESIKATHRTPASQAEYSALIENPQFLAGVVDARGHLYLRDDKPRVNSRHFLISSRNRQLLMALKERYGGGNYYRERESRRKGGKRMTIFTWEITNRGELDDLFARCKPYLRFGI